MNAFSWLLVGHLIGDWLLQNDWMASGKKQSLISLAGFIHYLLYTVVIIGVVWLFCAVGESTAFYFLAGLAVFLSHWLIDATSIVERWMRFYGQDPSRDFMRIIIDQTMHVIILALLGYACTLR